MEAKEIIRFNKYTYEVEGKKMLGYKGIAILFTKEFKIGWVNFWEQELIFGIYLGFLHIGIYQEWEEVK